MATYTFRTQINDTAYTKVGDNVTTFSAVENYVGSVKVVVTDPGDAAPAAGETNFVPLDGLYQRDSAARDIWMISPNGTTIIYGEAV